MLLKMANLTSGSVMPVPWCGRYTGRRLDPNAVYRLYLDKLHT